MIEDVYYLNNSYPMPKVGLGVYKITEEEMETSIEAALAAGYRAFDTAYFYKNEIALGNALKHSDIPREDLFITSKLWLTDYGQDNVAAGYQKSLDSLGLDYLDLYLIHWPGTDEAVMIDTWKGMEALYEAGKVKNIGVSNFTEDNLETLKAHTSIKPVINQVEFHPYLTQRNLRNYLASENIQAESWSPLMNAEILTDETVNDIAQELGKSPAQVVIRWNIDHGVVTIPKSITPHRIDENLNVFDFSLSTEQIERIDALNQDRRIGPNPVEFNG